MTRVSPPELDRELPGPHESMSVTCAPRRRRCSAVHPPNAPAPTTTMRGADCAKTGWPSKSAAATGTAAAPAINVRREITVSEIHACTEADRAWLIREIRDASAQSSLPVQRQKRRLVG